MDEPQARHSDRPSGDLAIYVITLIATVVIVLGLFAWIRIDPVAPKSSTTPESTATPR